MSPFYKYNEFMHSFFVDYVRIKSTSKKACDFYKIFLCPLDVPDRGTLLKYYG